MELKPKNGSRKYAICVSSKNVEDTRKFIPSAGEETFYKRNFQKVKGSSSLVFKGKPSPRTRKVSDDFLENNHKVQLQEYHDLCGSQSFQEQNDLTRTFWPTKSNNKMDSTKLLQFKLILQKAPYVQSLLGITYFSHQMKSFLQQKYLKTNKDELEHFIPWALQSSTTPGLKLCWPPNLNSKQVTFYIIEIKTPSGLLPAKSLIFTSTREINIQNKSSAILQENLYCGVDWADAFYHFYQGTGFGNLFPKKGNYNSWIKKMLNASPDNLKKKALLELLKNDPALKEKCVNDLLVKYLNLNKPVKDKNFLTNIAHKFGWKTGKEIEKNQGQQNPGCNLF